MPVYIFEAAFNQGHSIERRTANDDDAAIGVGREILARQKAAAIAAYGDIPAIRNASQSCAISVEIEHRDESADGFRPDGLVLERRYVGSI